jgi:thioredoxin 1
LCILHRFPPHGIYYEWVVEQGFRESGPEILKERAMAEVTAGHLVGEVSDADFEKQVLQSETPVLVDFWAAWCGPCRALGPVVEAVAQEYSGKLKVVKMDVDKNNMTPGRYGIRGIPALLLFKGGKVADQIVGYVPKEQIDQTLKRVLV